MMKRFLSPFLALTVSCLVIFIIFRDNKPSTDPAPNQQVEVASTDDAPNIFTQLTGLSPDPKASCNTGGQISEYVRRTLQDSKGSLWFGSNGYGLIRYNGYGLDYFSVEEGLGGTQVTGIIEDQHEQLWVATDGGVSVYDGKSFTTYTEEQGLSHRRCWSILEDSQGTIWVGTVAGLCRFDGESFQPFPLPTPEVAESHARFSNTLVRCIFEDSQGKLWFGTDGLGVFIYDGESFNHLSKEDGLGGNQVVDILEDQEGSFWFGTMFGGLTHFDGMGFTHYTHWDSIGNNEVWNVFEDRKGNIWCSSEGHGVYCYDGKRFRNYSVNEGLMVRAVQTIYEDRAGNLWVGGGGGLYRLERDRFVNVTKKGPWPC